MLRTSSPLRELHVHAETSQTKSQSYSSKPMHSHAQGKQTSANKIKKIAEMISAINEIIDCSTKESTPLGILTALSESPNNFYQKEINAKIRGSWSRNFKSVLKQNHLNYLNVQCLHNVTASYIVYHETYYSELFSYHAYCQSKILSMARFLQPKLSFIREVFFHLDKEGEFEIGPDVLEYLKLLAKCIELKTNKIFTKIDVALSKAIILLNAFYQYDRLDEEVFDRIRLAVISEFPKPMNNILSAREALICYESLFKNLCALHAIWLQCYKHNIGTMKLYEMELTLNPSTSAELIRKGDFTYIKFPSNEDLKSRN